MSKTFHLDITADLGFSGASFSLSWLKLFLEACHLTVWHNRTWNKILLISKSRCRNFEFIVFCMQELIGKGSYGIVCSAIDTKTQEKVAIKKINNVFDHVSDATRILREIKLLRLLRHPGRASSAPRKILSWSVLLTYSKSSESNS